MYVPKCDLARRVPLSAHGVINCICFTCSRYMYALSELSVPLYPLISSRMHIDPEIFVSLVRGTSETLFFEIRPYFIIFPLFGILKFTKKNSFTCFCYKWCVKFSFGSRDIKLYLFNLFGIHVLSEFSFSLIPLLSSRMHIDSEISLFTCLGNKWKIILRNKSLLYIFPFEILKFTKRTLSPVSASSDVVRSLSAHGVLSCISFTCLGYMCYRNCPFPCSQLFLLGCILIPKLLFHLFGEQVKHYSSK